MKSTQHYHFFHLDFEDICFSSLSSLELLYITCIYAKYMFIINMYNKNEGKGSKKTLRNNEFFFLLKLKLIMIIFPMVLSSMQICFKLYKIWSKYDPIFNVKLKMEASEPKWVNPNDIQYAVNSLRLEGLQIYIVASKPKSVNYDYNLYGVNSLRLEASILIDCISM